MESLETMYERIGISKEVIRLGAGTEASLKERFEAIDRTAEYNQLKVLHAMQKKQSGRSTFFWVHRIWIQ